MRRFEVELYGEEFLRRISGTPFKDIESIELLHLLNSDQKEFAGIFRIAPKDPDMDAEDVFKGDDATTQVQLLQSEKGGSSIIFMRRATRPGILGSHANMANEEGYRFGPLAYKNGRVRMRFVGTQRYVRKILREIEARGIDYRVVSIGDFSFSADSPLDGLTEKQRELLTLAYRLGYYDVPKKIDSEKLANRVNLRRATVVEHLRKAEYRLLTQIMESGRSQA